MKIFIAGAVLVSLFVFAVFFDGVGHVTALFQPEQPEESEFVPDDWTPKGPVPLPLLGRVDINTGKDVSRIHPTDDPVEFDSSRALDRPTWKVIVINQFKGRAGDTYTWDSNLLKYMEGLKTHLTGVGLPTEVWFMRLNRPYRDNGWTLPDMYRKCGQAGEQCFDEYLVFAQSSLDYSLERDYLSTLTDRCDLDEYTPAMAAVIVDPEGRMRHAYSSCLIQVSAKHILRNFDHHTDADINLDGRSVAEIPPHPAYALETSAKDNMKLQGRNLIRQAVKAAAEASEKAKESYDSAVEAWE